ncbi:nicotinate phosphoribosyltransferase OS=Streptomyces microflavus OX=1919 GN=Smic_27980 PE=4 SV=1 [Streptomyces microflavus]
MAADARRTDEDGAAEAEVIGTGPVPEELAGRELLVELVRGGEM